MVEYHFIIGIVTGLLWCFFSFFTVYALDGGCYCSTSYIPIPAPSDLVDGDITKLYDPYCFAHLNDQPEYKKCFLYETNSALKAQITKKTDGCFCEYINNKSSNYLDDKIDVEKVVCDKLVTSQPKTYKSCAWYKEGSVETATSKPAPIIIKDGCYCLSGGGTEADEQFYQGKKTPTECQKVSNDGIYFSYQAPVAYPVYCKWYKNNKLEGMWKKGAALDPNAKKNGCYCTPELSTTEEVMGTETQDGCKGLSGNFSLNYGKCVWYKDGEIIDTWGKIKKPVEPEQPNPFVVPSTASLNKIDTVDPRILAARIISTLMGVLGSIALVMFIYGGILWMTDLGNAERETKAKHIIVWTALGLAVIFASYALLKIVFEAFK